MVNYQFIISMNINKIIIGLAQSNSSYGFDKSKNISKVVKNLELLGIHAIDTSPTYKNSHKYVNMIKKKNIFNKIKSFYINDGSKFWKYQILPKYLI